MYAGRLIELGPAEQAFRAPGHPYTRGLLRAIPSPTRAHVLEGMEGQPPRPGARPNGCFFAARCEFAREQCTTGFPPAYELDGLGHWARCLRADEVSQLPALGELPLREHARPVRAEQPLLRIDALGAMYGETSRCSRTSRSPSTRSAASRSWASPARARRRSPAASSGLHSNWSGTIEFDGKPLAHDHRKRPPDAVRSLQYVFQNPYTSLNPRKTVGRLIEQPLRQLFKLSASEREQRVVAALRDSALNEDYLNRYPDQLSGGERQRVAIARALVVEPKLLVCDEVTSALDVSVQAAIVELLHRLKIERGLTLVLITHNLALVRSLADDVVILRDGQVVEQGQEVLDSPKSEYALQLLADVPSLSLV